jgi:hypothetical protein
MDSDHSGELASRSSCPTAILAVHTCGHVRGASRAKDLREGGCVLLGVLFGLICFTAQFDAQRPRLSFTILPSDILLGVVNRRLMVTPVTACGKL